MNTFDNIDNAKSYATEENLLKALKNLGLDHAASIVVRNRQGRFTAIFYRCSEAFGGDIGRAARHGFKSLG